MSGCVKPSSRRRLRTSSLSLSHDMMLFILPHGPPKLVVLAAAGRKTPLALTRYCGEAHRVDQREYAALEGLAAAVGFF
jgi:hypothetical protein